MSVDLAFKRLSLRPSGLCQQCRRAFASSARRPQQQSATGAFAESLQAHRAQSTASPSRSAPRTATAPLSPPRETTTASRPSPETAQRTAHATGLSILKDNLTKIAADSAEKRAEEAARQMAVQYTTKDYESQSSRRWRAGDVYAPHDLSGVEMAKWKKNRRKGAQGIGQVKWDVLDQLGIDPREHYKNFSIMSEYMTEMGRIKHRRETGLRPVNQRRMAKAIRRAIGMGLMPGVHRHPEILRIEMNQRMNAGRAQRR